MAYVLRRLLEMIPVLLIVVAAGVLAYGVHLDGEQISIDRALPVMLT